MLIVGERINTSRKRTGKAVEARDAEFIAEEARKQAEAGASMIDVNAGTSVSREVEDLKWLVRTVQAAVDLPLCLDSPNPKALEAALAEVEKPPMVNSVTAEKQRLDEILPLVKEHDAFVVGLCMSEGGMPEGAEDRLEAARIILDAAKGVGIPPSNVYFDPVITPVSSKPEDAMAAIRTVQEVMTRFEGAHSICGLSNISYGLPRRNVLNRTFLAFLMSVGLDAAIMDPTEPHMMATLLAAAALRGDDEYCMSYIRAGRDNRLD